MNRLNKFSRTLMGCALFASIAIIACVAGYFGSAMSARAAGEKTCNTGGITASWVGLQNDVTCDDVNDIIINNSATEIKLKGNATKRVGFFSEIPSFKKLNLDNLTNTDCLNEGKCVNIVIKDSISATIEVQSNSQISSLYTSYSHEINIIGNGSLTIGNAISYEYSMGILNLYSDLTLNGGLEGDEMAIYVEGNLNILGGNIDINIDDPSVVGYESGYSVISAGYTKIANEAIITATVNNPSSDTDMILLFFNQGLDIGDKIVIKRNGTVINSGSIDADNLIIAAGDRAVFTFGAPATGPTDPNGPASDLTPPNTGIRRF